MAHDSLSQANICAFKIQKCSENTLIAPFAKVALPFQQPMPTTQTKKRPYYLLVPLIWYKKWKFRTITWPSGLHLTSSSLHDLSSRHLLQPTATGPFRHFEHFRYPFCPTSLHHCLYKLSLSAPIWWTWHDSRQTTRICHDLLYGLQNGFKFSGRKTTFVHFWRWCAEAGAQKLNGKAMKVERVIKFLGLVSDQSLSFKPFKIMLFRLCTLQRECQYLLGSITLYT